MCIKTNDFKSFIFRTYAKTGGGGGPSLSNFSLPLLSPFAIKRERIHPVHSPRSHHGAQSLFSTQPLQSQRPARKGLDHSLALVFRSRHRPPRTGIRLRQHLASRRPPGSSRGQR